MLAGNLNNSNKWVRKCENFHVRAYADEKRTHPPYRHIPLCIPFFRFLSLFCCFFVLYVCMWRSVKNVHWHKRSRRQAVGHERKNWTNDATNGVPSLCVSCFLGEGGFLFFLFRDHVSQNSHEAPAYTHIIAALRLINFINFCRTCCAVRLPPGCLFALFGFGSSCTGAKGSFILLLHPIVLQNMCKQSCLLLPVLVSVGLGTTKRRQSIKKAEELIGVKLSSSIQGNGWSQHMVGH